MDKKIEYAVDLWSNRRTATYFPLYRPYVIPGRVDEITVFDPYGRQLGDPNFYDVRPPCKDEFDSGADVHYFTFKDSEEEVLLYRETGYSMDSGSSGGGSGGGSSITVDSELSDSSTNPVQNKVVTNALSGKVAKSDVGAANGVAGLDGNGLVPSTQLPVAGNATTKNGVISYNTGYGIKVNANGVIQTIKATQDHINARLQEYCPIVPNNLDYAVRSVLPNVTVIPDATTEYALLDASATTNSHSCTYWHTPNAAPTYALPAVTDSTIAHEITLEVNYAAYARSSPDDSGSAYAWKYGTTLIYTDTDTPTAGTTKAYSDTALTTELGTIAAYASDAVALAVSCSFEDASAAAVTPMSAPTIAPGTVVDYLIRWSPSLAKWCIMPVVMG